MSDESFWSIRFADVVNSLILVVTIVAIIYGPIKAVDISRKQDIARDSLARKRSILTALMRTRKMGMNPDHVGALNQVQVEFYDHQKVVETYKSYISNLSESVPSPGNDLDNFITRRNDLFFDLLYEMCKAADVPLDRHDIGRLAYVPFGWQTEQAEIQRLRNAMTEVLEGRRPLHVVAGQTQSSPYPPAPT